MDLTKRSTTIKYIIAVLIWIAVLGLSRDTPAHINKKVVSRVSTNKVTAVVKTAPITEQPEPEIKTAVATPVVTPVPAPQPQPSSHEDLMSLAGISQSDWPAVDYIVTHESGWNPDATEPNSGAHGLPQALPYSKTGCDWDDAVCQLSWANTYAVSRYGGWWSAYSYWVANHNW